MTWKRERVVFHLKGDDLFGDVHLRRGETGAIVLDAGAKSLLDTAPK